MRCANYSSSNGLSHRGRSLTDQSHFTPCTRLEDVHVICLFTAGAVAPRYRRRVAPHMRSEGATMAELHYMEMGWSGSGWMDPLPMENTPAPAPSSRPSSFGDLEEPAPARSRPARPRRKSAKKSSSRKSAKRSRGRAKKSAKKSTKKAARRGARKSTRKSARKAAKGGRSARKRAKKGGRRR